MASYIHFMYLYAIRCETISKEILTNLQFREDKEGGGHDDGDNDAEDREKKRLNRLIQVKAHFPFTYHLSGYLCLCWMHDEPVPVNGY